MLGYAKLYVSYFIKGGWSWSQLNLGFGLGSYWVNEMIWFSYMQTWNHQILISLLSWLLNKISSVYGWLSNWFEWQTSSLCMHKWRFSVLTWDDLGGTPKVQQGRGREMVSPLHAWWQLRIVVSWHHNQIVSILRTETKQSPFLEQWGVVVESSQLFLAHCDATMHTTYQKIYVI